MQGVPKFLQAYDIILLQNTDLPLVELWPDQSERAGSQSDSDHRRGSGPTNICTYIDSKIDR